MIVGSDVLRDLKLGVPTSGGTGNTMIDIMNSVGCDTTFSEWINIIDPLIMKEMRSFRQYKNTLVELVLSQMARELIDEPCRYFLTKFPTLFMCVYRAIKSSARQEKTCYKPFF
ncbi:hypothetical protein KUTeg_019602 [Tegillarca granosa]|uniref:KEN domain-containing protein n=1 Tax=Tegillarca granosa TaxID=220873 RepID=A0ABQ9EH89_TEGGR|nr:hypothetical protein KUTeg_019602 [Tegillarca granosa]